MWGAVGEDVEGVGALVVLGALDEDLVAGGVEVDEFFHLGWFLDGKRESLMRLSLWFIWCGIRILRCACRLCRQVLCALRSRCPC